LEAALRASPALAIELAEITKRLECTWEGPAGMQELTKN
jgi:hypothetical protein